MALSDMESASLTVKNILSPKHLTLVIDKGGNVINEILCPDALALYFGDDRYLFYKSMNDAEGLMYMKKDDIETGGDWKQVFE